MSRKIKFIKSNNRTNTNAITTTGYKGGYLSNNAKVRIPRPLPRRQSFTAKVELTDYISFVSSQGKGTVSFLGIEQDTSSVTDISITTRYFTQILAQLAPYASMFKAIYTKAMTIELIPVTGNTIISSLPLYFKASFNTTETIQNMQCIEPIVIVPLGKQKLIHAGIPFLNQQYKTAETTEEAVLTNRWVDFPTQTSDIQNLLVPTLHFYIAGKPDIVVLEAGTLWQVNIKILFGMAANDVLSEVVKPSGNFASRTVNYVGKKIKQGFNYVKDNPEAVIDGALKIAKAISSKK